MSRLENWYVDDSDCLIGAVYEDPRFSDGTVVRTSRVIEIDKATGKARTKNTKYELGKPYDLNPSLPTPEASV